MKEADGKQACCDKVSSGRSLFSCTFAFTTRQLPLNRQKTWRRGRRQPDGDTEKHARSPWWLSHVPIPAPSDGSVATAHLREHATPWSGSRQGTRTQEQRPLTKHHGANGRVLAVKAQRRGRITGEAGPMWSEAGPFVLPQGPSGSTLRNRQRARPPSPSNLVFVSFRTHGPNPCSFPLAGGRALADPWRWRMMRRLGGDTGEATYYGDARSKHCRIIVESDLAVGVPLIRLIVAIAGRPISSFWFNEAEGC